MRPEGGARGQWEEAGGTRDDSLELQSQLDKRREEKEEKEEKEKEEEEKNRGS